MIGVRQVVLDGYLLPGWMLGMLHIFAALLDESSLTELFCWEMSCVAEFSTLNRIFLALLDARLATGSLPYCWILGA